VIICKCLHISIFAFSLKECETVKLESKRWGIGYFLMWRIFMVEVKFISEVMKIFLSFRREILPYNKLSIIFVVLNIETGLDHLFVSLLPLVSRDFMF